MKKEKRSFTETRFYPVVFMIIITVFFVGILAAFYNSTKEKIRDYDELSLKSSILKCFDLPVSEVEKTFDQYIELVQNDKIEYFKAVDNEKILGYCIPISGPGLWGKIDALLTVTSNLSTIINIDIIKQNETPGLGGRISEEWFKKQFKGKVLFLDDKIQEFVLIPENEPAGSDNINQITGATFSSKAVINIISKEMGKKKLIIK